MKLTNLSTLVPRKEYSFHTVYVVRRCLDQNRLLYHWALVFEGEWLLRIEFFQNGHIEWFWNKNKTQTRRAFWFHNENFTNRWLILLTLKAIYEEEPLHATQIGYWLIDWHQRRGNYDTLSNNCQHFVRDIVAHFNTSKALDLNGLMDVQSGTALVPGMLLSNGIEQFTRTYYEWNKSQNIECPSLNN